MGSFLLHRWPVCLIVGHTVIPCGSEPLWRGGLPPFDCAAVAIPADAVYLRKQRAASQPNGGKPPRHRLFTGLQECCWPQGLQQTRARVEPCSKLTVVSSLARSYNEKESAWRVPG